MSPTTRSRSQRGPSQGVSPSHESNRNTGSDDEVSDASTEEEEDDGDDEEEKEMLIRSPTTNISYDISCLDPETQASVRQLFQEPQGEDMPRFVLQWCQSVQEQQDGQFYAFQMHEIVRRSRAVRIGSTRSKYSRPRCNCMGDSDTPCKHLLFLLDQLNYHTSDRPLSETPVRLGSDGDWEARGHPFERISNFHLDLLASSMHCDVGPPDSRPTINPVRLQEVREILVSIAEPDMDDYDVQGYRPDIFENPDATFEDDDIISHNDLTRTIANMLMTNNEFFSYFLKLLGPSSKAGNPFRKIQQHIDRVLSELDAYARNPSTAKNAGEGPRNVPWAAMHITRAIAAIESLLQNRTDAPSAPERAAAARVLMRILHNIIIKWNRDVPYNPVAAIKIDIIGTTSSSSSSSRVTPDPSLHRPPRQRQGSETTPITERNLYQRLIGSQTRTSSAFVIDVLAQLPEQNQWIEELEKLEGRLGQYNPPAGYMGRLRDLIVLMRSSRPAGEASSGSSASMPAPNTSRTGGKRRGGGWTGREGGAKRAK